MAPDVDEKLSDALLVGLAVPLGAIVYFALLNLLGFEDIGELKNLLLRKKKLGKRVSL